MVTVVPVANPGKFGVALDQGEPGGESDGFFDGAVDSVASSAFDPLNILQVADRTDFNDQQTIASKAGPSKGPVGRWVDGDGTDENGPIHADRWVVEWGNDTEAGYRRKLDHLGICLGAVRDGRLVGAFKGFEFERRESVNDPPKLWFVHQDRGRTEVDRALLSNSGLKLQSTDVVAQFFPPQLQAQMASLERRYSHKNAAEIKRTVFGVRAAGAGFELYVIEQQLK